jgi:hypothetical protein
MIIAFVFLGLAVLHVILHWRTIVSIYSRMLKIRAARRIIAMVIFIAGLFFVTFPLIVKPEVQEPERKGRHQRERTGYPEEMNK